MPYISHYKILYDDLSVQHIYLIKKYMKENIFKSHKDKDECVDEMFDNGYLLTWYSFEEDMCELSSSLKNVKITVDVCGEEIDDKFMYTFINGSSVKYSKDELLSYIKTRIGLKNYDDIQYGFFNEKNMNRSMSIDIPTPESQQRHLDNTPDNKKDGYSFFDDQIFEFSFGTQ